MKRIVVFGQPGRYGCAVGLHVARHLAARLRLPVVPIERPGCRVDAEAGWIAVGDAHGLRDELLRAADTGIWLHYLPSAVGREWLQALRRGAPRRHSTGAVPTLGDLAASVLHMACTPEVLRRLRQRAAAHLQVFHLRNPGETDFWLHAQDHRLAPDGASAQPA